MLSETAKTLANSVKNIVITKDISSASDKGTACCMQDFHMHRETLTDAHCRIMNAVLTFKFVRGEDHWHVALAAGTTLRAAGAPHGCARCIEPSCVRGGRL